MKMQGERQNNDLVVPPMGVFLVAGLLTYLGVLSVVGMILAPFMEHTGWSLDLSFILLFLSYGLFTREDSSRRWTVFWSGVLCVLFGGVLIAWLGFGIGWWGASNEIDGDPSAGPLDWVLMVVTIAGPFWSLWYFRRDKAKSWALRDGTENPETRRLFWGLVLVSAMISASFLMLNEEHETEKAAIYGFNLEFVAVDDQTGERIEGLSVGSSGNGDFPRSYQTRSNDNGEGVSMVVSGLANEPFEFDLGAEGYSNYKFGVEKDGETYGKQEIRLERVLGREGAAD